LILGYVALAVWTWQAPVLWFPVAVILLTFWVFQLARNAAERWGEWVKGAFDVFLPALCNQMGYALPATFEEERQLWHSLSQAMVFRDEESRAELARFRLKAAALEGDSATNPSTPKPKT
jgi:hypothetical protein